MVRNLKLYLFVMLTFVLAGCGGGNTGPGNTVYVSASTKDGTSLAVFGHMSSTRVWVANPISVTIKSTPYTTASSVDKSDVIINKVAFKYTPINGAFDFNPPTFSSLDLSVRVEPGGSSDIDNIPILYSTDMAKIAAGSLAGSIPQYKVDLTFSGIEVNTGASVSTSYSTTAAVSIP